jgi:DNA-binding PadR family transcriptional regulator
MTSAFSMGGAGVSGPWPDPRTLRREMKHLLAAVAETWGGHHDRHSEHERHERHEHRHRGPRGPRGGFGWDFGPGPWGKAFMFGGGRPGWHRGRKAKRGDVRAAILALLSEEPRNGYQIIQEIAERSQGGWKPSPGAVYPALQQLTDEGLVRAEETDGRKTFHLTDAGRAYVAEHADDVRAPWEEMTPQVDDSAWEIMDLGRQTAAALFQVLQTGSDAQIRQARQTLVETRRKLYQILADGDPGEE